MEAPDCLGFTLAEARKALTATGWQLQNYTYTGPRRPAPGEEDAGRVVRVRLVGAGQVDLVLAYVDTDHQ
ncbi:hypothetical protein [Neomoorella thermoacetica]|uniref:PASTA domain-containing protein n=1 Tax=Neomoorella thermoacetica TaxID=1525 RepID=A0AAC9MUQ0_NEOTH|nr:hypothetical protein [Moorella thermoacetica]AOQ23716.1 hypothetical protein Maut_01266 [Moorella thermoacetica]OIQ56168.1 hypothetical protein MORE_00250 [Moorella thermoacetica]TYL13901.1 hypothetical protein MTAT_12990 [Moorella thermoacetica]